MTRRTRTPHATRTRQEERERAERTQREQRGREERERERQEERDAAPRAMDDARRALVLMDEIEAQLYALSAISTAPAWIEIEEDEEVGQVARSQAYSFHDLAVSVSCAQAHVAATLARAERIAAGLEP